MQNTYHENITMTDVQCNKVEHSLELIKALCLNPQCQDKENCTLCSICLIKSHPDCRNQVMELKQIPIQLKQFQQLKFNIISLQEMINDQLKQLLSLIDLELSPIQKYQDSPNMTNLTQIGFLLKNFKESKIHHSIEEVKTNIKKLLENQNHQQDILQSGMPDPNLMLDKDSQFVVKYTWMISEKNHEILQRITGCENKFLCKRMAVRNQYVTEIIDLKKYINIHNLMAGIRNKVIPTVSHLKLLEIYSELDLFREFLKKYDLSDIECKNIWVPLETDKFELMITNIFDDSKSFRNKGFSDTLIEFHKFLREQQKINPKGMNRIIFKSEKIEQIDQKCSLQVGWSPYRSILVEAQINNLCLNNNLLILNQKDDYSMITRQLQNWQTSLNNNYSNQYFSFLKKYFTINKFTLFVVALQDEFIRDICYSLLILLNQQFNKPISDILEDNDLKQFIDQLSQKYINEELQINIEKKVQQKMNEIEQLLQ